MKLIKNFKNMFISIFCAVIIISAGFFAIAYKEDNKNVNAMTDTSSPSVVNIGEILLDNYETSDKFFDGKKLSSLYSLLTGNGKAVYNDLEALFTRSQVTSFGSSVVKGTTINANAKNRDIVLKFGNIEWTVTSLTKDSDGNIVATLLQATSSTDTSKYSLWDPTNSTANLTYPANMYSTSYIRNVTLNAKGCGYVPNDTEGHKTNPTLTGANTQSETNKFAKFTMEDIEGSLTNYIVTPAKIKYQETQNHYLLNTSICYSNPNGAWGIPEGTFKMYTNGFNVNYLPVPGYTANTKQYYA